MHTLHNRYAHKSNCTVVDILEVMELRTSKEGEKQA